MPAQQIWFPSGEAAGDDAKAGRSTFTRRSISVLYAPSGASEQPAATISHHPLDVSGLGAPALKVEAGAFSQGDAVLVEKFSTTGAFFTGEIGGVDTFSVEGDGDMWNLGTMYAHKANVGGIVAATDGTVALDMTLGNVFTSTPSQNTVWSTSAPTDGIGGELASFVVNNSGGYTVSWGTGFTNVDAIGASDTGIHTRLLQFDGATWHQIAATLDGRVVNPGIGMALAPINRPDLLDTVEIELLYAHSDKFPNGVTVLSCGLNTGQETSTFSIDYEIRDAPNDGTPTAVATVATAASIVAEDAGLSASAVAVDEYIYAILPATTVNRVNVWVTYRIN